jgi:hypothetical protein
MSIYDPCGEQVDGGDSQATGYRLTVSMAGSRAGTYTVEWVVLSSVDGHTTEGSFTFTATEGDSCPGTDSDPGGGGGNKTDGGSRPRGGGGSQPDSGSGSGSAAPSGPGTADDTRGAGDGKGKSTTRRGRDGRQGADGRTASDLDTAAAPQPEDAPARDGDDIPIGGLLIALAIAALIGAAGGRVYVGIMGR